MESRRSEEEGEQEQSGDGHDVCMVIGSDVSRKRVWQLNSRSLCVVDNICITQTSQPDVTPLGHSLSPSSILTRFSARSPLCKAVSHTLTPYNETSSSRAASEFGGCAHLQEKLVHCAHGSGLQHTPDDVKCPSLQRGGDIQAFASMQDVEIWEETSVIVPDYPYQRNIYHYLNMATLTAWTIAHLPTVMQMSNRTSPHMPVTTIHVIFRGARTSAVWQSGILVALFTYISRTQNVRIVPIYMTRDEDPLTTICTRSAVLLGRRGHMNVWPFGNDTRVSSSGSYIGRQAVWTRQAVYEAADVNGVFVDDSHTTMHAPGAEILYARRTYSDARGISRDGLKRRFTESDESWLVSTLAHTARTYNMSFRTVTSHASTPFHEQVCTYEDAGVVVGIHGANMVNCAWMRPFASVVEIFPGGVESRCYVAGMNSGLLYRGVHVAGERCGGACGRRLRASLVDISAVEVRREIEVAVRQAVESVVRLRRSGKDGVAVREVDGGWEIVR